MSALNAPSAVLPPSQAHLDKGYGAINAPRSNLAPFTAAADFSTPGNPATSSPLSQSAAQQNYGRFNEEWDASQRGSSIIDGPMQHTNSIQSQGDTALLPRGGTLKKKASLRRSGSLKKSGSRRSSRAGSVRSLALQPAADIDEMQSAFFSPVPTSGNPTEILANRFQAWRKLLKDLITYFREIQTSYDHRAKTLLKISNVINNTTAPSVFLTSDGIDDALQIMRTYHKTAIAEANKSKDIENDVILALAGLRSDLQQKIKEIKALNGDFKNSVDKEMENTRRAVNTLQDGLGQSDIDPAQMTGKQDPYLLKLAVDRQVEKQIDEENYLHQAYLNLEASGRELEAIVVGEIQKSYNAYAGILKREADGAYSAVEDLRTGPIAMPKDHEWNAFVEKDEHFVDPSIPVRQAQHIQYPGRDNELAQEVRAGLLERKSKYLKSYTAGWYVLSPTHLHEFKSADKTQAPIMSLFLPEQKLGSHSAEGGSSNKFMLKGRQTGAMHRGHSWVFRAESRDTMLAWYEDIKILTEKSPQERNAFVRQHARSVSGTSQKAGSVSSDGIMDEEDEEPFFTSNSMAVAQEPKQDVVARRPQPGGRFPSSDLLVNTHRSLQAPLSPSSGSSGFGDVQDRDIALAAGATPINGAMGQHYGEDTTTLTTHAAMVNQFAQQDGINPYTYQPIQNSTQSENHVPLGVAGSIVYPNHREDKINPETESALGGETHNQSSEAYATHEATVFATPSIRNPIPSDEQLIHDGRDIVDMPATGADFRRDGHSGQSTTGQPEDRNLSTPLGMESRTLTEPKARATVEDGKKHLSVQSISQLHIPGEYPKGAVA